MALVTQKDFQELRRRCGELDYLMGRLKSSLEKKISKQETLSPYQRWLGKTIEKRGEEEKKTDEELRRILKEASAEREKREKREKRGKEDRGGNL